MLNTKYNFTAEGTEVACRRANEHHSRFDSVPSTQPSGLFTAVFVYWPPPSRSVPFRPVPSPPLASPNCILFIIMHPLSRSVLSSPRRPLPSHISIGHPMLRGAAGRDAMGRKPIYLSQRRISHLEPRIRHARAALLPSPIKGYYDGAI